MYLELYNDSHFEQVSSLFNEVKEYFPNIDIEEIKKEPHLFCCFKDGIFWGCLWLDNWNKNHCYMGGFSKRKNPYTLEFINILVNHTFKNYGISRIYSDTENRHTRLCLRKAGFKKINNNLYERIKI